MASFTGSDWSYLVISKEEIDAFHHSTDVIKGRYQWETE